MTLCQPSHFTCCVHKHHDTSIQDNELYTLTHLHLLHGWPQSWETSRCYQYSRQTQDRLTSVQYLMKMSSAMYTITNTNKLSYSTIIAYWLCDPNYRILLIIRGETFSRFLQISSQTQKLFGKFLYVNTMKACKSW